MMLVYSQQILESPVEPLNESLALRVVRSSMHQSYTSLGAQILENRVSELTPVVAVEENRLFLTPELDLGEQFV